MIRTPASTSLSAAGVDLPLERPGPRSLSRFHQATTGCGSRGTGRLPPGRPTMGSFYRRAEWILPDARLAALADDERPVKRRDWTDEVVEAVVVLLALGLAVAAGVGGFFLGRDTKHVRAVAPAATTTATVVARVDPSVAAGAHDFVQFACAQCHGMQGQGGISPDVPALKTVGKALTPAQLRQIINHGLGESANPTKPYMPVWGEVISTQQVNDLSPMSARGCRACRLRRRPPSRKARASSLREPLSTSATAASTATARTASAASRIRSRRTRRSRRSRAPTSTTSSTPTRRSSP